MKILTKLYVLCRYIILLIHSFFKRCLKIVNIVWLYLYNFYYYLRTGQFANLSQNIVIYMWYLYVKIGVSKKFRNSLLSWVNGMVKDNEKICNNFTSDWKDGTILCALCEALLPGSFPRYDLLNPNNAKENLIAGLRVVEMIINCGSVISTEEVLKYSAESEKKLLFMVVLLRLKSRYRDKSLNVFEINDILPKVISHKGCVAKGMGLMQAIRGRKSYFNIYFKSSSDLNIVIEIKGPKKTKCSKRITNRSPQFTRNNSVCSNKDLSLASQQDSFSKQICMEYDIHPRKLSVSYIPIHAGKHDISIVWQGRHMIGSPYTVRVDETCDEENLNVKFKAPKLLSLHKMASFDIPDEEFEPWPSKEEIFLKSSGIVKKRRTVRQIIIINGQEIVLEDPLSGNGEKYWSFSSSLDMVNCEKSSKDQDECSQKAKDIIQDQHCHLKEDSHGSHAEIFKNTSCEIENSNSIDVQGDVDLYEIDQQNVAYADENSNSNYGQKGSGNIKIEEKQNKTFVEDKMQTSFDCEYQNLWCATDIDMNEKSITISSDDIVKPTHNSLYVLDSSEKILENESFQDVEPFKTEREGISGDFTNDTAAASIHQSNQFSESNDLAAIESEIWNSNEVVIEPSFDLSDSKPKVFQSNKIEDYSELKRYGSNEETDRKANAMQWSDLSNEKATSIDSLNVFYDSFSDANIISEEQHAYQESCLYHDDFIRTQGFWENMSSDPQSCESENQNIDEKKLSLVKQRKAFWERKMQLSL